MKEMPKLRPLKWLYCHNRSGHLCSTKKLWAYLKLSGDVHTPEISKNFGDYTIDFKYDETTADTIQYSFTQHDPLVNQNSSWQATGAGTAEVKMGLMPLLASWEPLIRLNAVFSHMAMAELNFCNKGSFSNPQPRVGLDAFLASGCSLCRSRIFGGQPVLGGYLLPMGLNRPNLKTRFKNWIGSIVETNTRPTFRDVTFINNGTGAVLNIGSDFATGNGAHSGGYNIYVRQNQLPNTYFCNTDNAFPSNPPTR